MKSIVLIFLFFLCYLYADDFENGLKAYEDGNYEKAIKFYKKACDSGVVKACHNLGYSFAQGDNVKLDYKESIKYFKKACDSGYATSCYNLGLMYYKGYDKQPDYKNAYIYYQKACNDVEAIGCFELGSMYYNAYGVERNKEKSLEFYHKACNNGDGYGCAFLAVMYAVGTDVGKDSIKALELYNKSCDLGYSVGCIKYDSQKKFIDTQSEADLKFYDGYYEEALELYEKNCENDMKSCFKAAQIYQKGTRTKLDYKKAFELYIKSCIGTFEDACYSLCEMSTYIDVNKYNDEKAIHSIQTICYE